MMKSLMLAMLISFSLASGSYASLNTTHEVVTAKKGKSEPAPKDDDRKGGGETPDSREETYEGNDRGNGSFDGGGYDNGDDGGMMGEVFFTRGTKTYPVTTTVKKEDRGSVIVYTTTVQEDINASESCTTVTVTVVDKATNKTISTDSNEFCNHLQ